MPPSITLTYLQPGIHPVTIVHIAYTFVKLEICVSIHDKKKVYCFVKI